MGLFEKAQSAVRDLHADTSVSRGRTKALLEDLCAEIEALIDSLDDAESEDE